MENKFVLQDQKTGQVLSSFGDKKRAAQVSNVSRIPPTVKAFCVEFNDDGSIESREVSIRPAS